MMRAMRSVQNGVLKAKRSERRIQNDAQTRVNTSPTDC